MAHHRAARDSVIKLKVPIVIPGQCRNAIAGFCAQAFECVCQLPCALERLSKGITVSWIVGSDRNNFLVRIISIRRSQQARDH